VGSIVLQHGFCLLHFYFLRLVYGLDTWGLCISCLYFPPIHSRLYSWVWGTLIASSYKSRAGFIIVLHHGFCLVHFYFLRLGQGLNTRTLFITCRNFSPIHSRLYLWVWGILIASSSKSKGQSFVVDHGIRLLHFYFLRFGNGLDTRGLFIICMYFFPILSRLYSWVWGILIASSSKSKVGSVILQYGFCQLDTRGLFVIWRYFSNPV